MKWPILPRYQCQTISIPHPGAPSTAWSTVLYPPCEPQLAKSQSSICRGLNPWGRGQQFHVVFQLHSRLCSCLFPKLQSLCLAFQFWEHTYFTCYRLDLIFTFPHPTPGIIFFKDLHKANSSHYSTFSSNVTFTEMSSLTTSIIALNTG